MSRSITAGPTPTDGFAGVRGGSARASDDSANLPSSSLHEQARQFSALLSEASPESPDDQRQPADETFSQKALACLQDPTYPKGLTSSKDPAVTQSLPSKEEPMFARAHHNHPLDTAIDPVDSSPRHEVNVASFLVPSWLSRQIPVAPAPAAAAPDLTLAELVHRHVRRTLASQATDGSGEDEVRLELSDAVLPGTTLSLRRTRSGWQLLATTGNRQSLDKLGRFTPALIARFAQASLGSLEVITHQP